MATSIEIVNDRVVTVEFVPVAGFHLDTQHERAVLDWLDANAQGRWSLDWVMTETRPKDFSTVCRMVVAFEKIEDAMAFRLTWL